MFSKIFVGREKYFGALHSVASLKLTVLIEHSRVRIYPGSVRVGVMSPVRAVSKQVYPQPLMPAKGRRLQRRKLEFFQISMH